MIQTAIQLNYIPGQIPETQVILGRQMNQVPETVVGLNYIVGQVASAVLKLNAIYDAAQGFILGTLDDPNTVIVDLDNGNTIEVQ